MYYVLCVLRFQLRYLRFLSTNYKDEQIFPMTMLSLLFKENKGEFKFFVLYVIMYINGGIYPKIVDIHSF